jgi:putative aldouronate transport system substrate-binding protein
MKKKNLMVLTSLALTASLFAGCSQDNNGGNTTPTASTKPQESAASETPKGYNGVDNLKISETPTKVTLFYPFTANGAPKGDMPVWKKAAEITNVSMENVASESITEEAQSFNAMLASGKLPDIIQGQRTTLDPIVNDGAFIALDELIEQHAPNIKKFLEDFPEARRAGTGSDGKLYTLTGTLGGEPGKALPSMGYFVRQDWLDKLSLPVPTTFEQLEQTLYAFREGDPNGNSKKDEIPLFSRNAGLWSLLEIWNATNSWYIGPDDKVYHGKTSEQFKTALTDLAKWYKDGIIDPEIYTRGGQARQFMLGNNLGGATIDWFASTAAVNDAVKEQVPDINFVAIAPPANKEGDVKMKAGRDPIHTFAWGISRDAADPELAIKYMDFFFTKEGEILTNFGIEGEHYDLVNGEPVLRDIALKHETGLPNFLRSIGGGYEIGRRGSLVGELSSMNEIGKAGFNLYAESNWIEKPFPVLTFTAEERKAIDDAMVNLNPYMDEYEQKVFMGAQDVNATWDAYLAELDKLKLQSAVDAYNSAYERYKSEG